MLGDIPEGGEQFGFIRAGHELDRAALGGVLLEILGGEQHLAALGIGVEHGDADDLRGERPEVELAENLLAPEVARRLVLDFLEFAQEIFLLRLVEVFQRERGGFDVENKFGHDGDRGKQKPGWKTCSTALAFHPGWSKELLLLFTGFLFFLAAMFVTSDRC